LGDVGRGTLARRGEIESVAVIDSIATEGVSGQGGHQVENRVADEGIIGRCGRPLKLTVTAVSADLVQQLTRTHRP
jgi:hypothetical protein